MDSRPGVASRRSGVVSLVAVLATATRLRNSEMTMSTEARSRRFPWVATMAVIAVVLLVIAIVLFGFRNPWPYTVLFRLYPN
jgi:hypothetical protein